MEDDYTTQSKGFIINTVRHFLTGSLLTIFIAMAVILGLMVQKVSRYSSANCANHD